MVRSALRNGSKNRSGLVNIGSNIGLKIEPGVPRNTTKTAREEASKSWEIFDETRLRGGTPEESCSLYEDAKL